MADGVARGARNERPQKLVAPDADVDFPEAVEGVDLSAHVGLLRRVGVDVQRGQARGDDPDHDKAGHQAALWQSESKGWPLRLGLGEERDDEAEAHEEDALESPDARVRLQRDRATQPDEVDREERRESVQPLAEASDKREMLCGSEPLAGQHTRCARRAARRSAGQKVAELTGCEIGPLEPGG
eukprot:scaffold194976_cov26-Tisochrysis_lutea.AAC.5